MMHHPYSNDMLMLQDLLRDNYSLYESRNSAMDAKFVLDEKLWDYKVFSKKLGAKFLHEIMSREGITRSHFCRAITFSFRSLLGLNVELHLLI